MKKQTLALDFLKWEKWHQSLNRIKQELYRLYFARGMFERLYSLANNSENLRKCPNDLFLVWSWNCYIVYLGMGIRRLIDRTSNAQNVYQLLEDIRDNACQLSVDNYAEYMFKKCCEGRIKNSQDATKPKKESDRNSMRNTALDIFEEVLGSRVQVLSLCDVEKDIKKVEESLKRVIERHVNERFAHLGKQKPTAPQLRQVHDALDLLIDIYNKYSLLIAGNTFTLPSEELFDEWDAPFRIAWVP